MTLSVIIPTYNEAEQIAHTIETVRLYDTAGLVHEIIVADGGSTDNTVQAARQSGANAIVSPTKGRAAQMNAGAAAATGDVLYFLHADTVPPQDFSTDILQAVKAGSAAGCYLLSFDHPHWFLKANCWFTRFDVDAFRYGDQSLFVQRKLFQNIGGFCEAHIVFEDYHIIKRLKRQGRFDIIKRPVITSARKYLDNGIYKMQGIFYLMYFLYRFGLSQRHLVATYKKLIRQAKL